MNIKTITVRTLAVSLAVLLAPATALAADKKIDIFVDKNSSPQKLKFDNSECPTEPNHKGCIKTERGDKNKIKWEFPENSDPTHPNNRKNWELTGLQMLKETLVPDDPSVPDVWDCVVSDFGLDPATGMSQAFKTKNWGGENDNGNGCKTGYQINYSLFARHKILGTSIDSDPVIRNGGKQTN